SIICIFEFYVFFLETPFNQALVFGRPTVFERVSLNSTSVDIEPPTLNTQPDLPLTPAAFTFAQVSSAIPTKNDDGRLLITFKSDALGRNLGEMVASILSNKRYPNGYFKPNRKCMMGKFLTYWIKR